MATKEQTRSPSMEQTTDHTPLPAALESVPTRLSHCVKLWIAKGLVAFALTLLKMFYNPKAISPTLTKRYTCRPNLEVRIFMPPHMINKEEKTDTDIQRKLHPLYINIHGGGFAIGDARIDDVFCAKWSRRTGMIVASLNYRKSPTHPFPTPVHDVAALAESVIYDDSLPIDRSQIITGGFSAGGNLAFTAALTPKLRGKIKAVISYFPVVDWSSNPESKFVNRLCKDRPTDGLALSGPALDWGYVSAGQDRKDKLLSPCFASNEELPPFICMIGAQHDMLCREARDMIYSLASRNGDDVKAPVVDEKGFFNWDEKFETKKYKWMLMKGMKHGFTDDLFQKENPRSEKRRKICDEMYADIYRWLKENVLD